MGSYDDTDDRQVKGKQMDDANELDEEVEKWLSGSLFLCKICDKKIAGTKEFNSHLVNEHDMPFYKYAKDYKDFRLISGYHFCKICSKNIKHDKEPLMKHMKEDHKISARDYFYEYKPKMPRSTKIADN